MRSEERGTQRTVEHATEIGPMTTSTPTYHEIESRLKTMEKTLERFARISVVNQYAAAVMHEVNNPLEAITNLVYLLENEEPLPATAQRRLAQLDEQLRILTQITRSSLSFHRGQTVAKEVDLVEIAESALKLHFARIAKNNVQVRKRFPPRAICNGVSGELLQVVSNLILNALDALPEQESASLHVRVHHTRSSVHITVADNGAGIPAHVEPALFNPNVTSKRNGTGLGLWLSERILQRHQGRIRVRTSRAAGRSGTVFRISLPHAAAA